MLPTTSNRVPEQTSPESNRHIRCSTDQRVAAFQNASPAVLERRVSQLENEWDTERALEANAASIVIAGVFLGATISRKWFLLPGVVGIFLLQHALQGWCPPLPIMRGLGVRTQREIDEERMALKVMRGDFDRLIKSREAERDWKPSELMEAVRR